MEEWTIINEHKDDHVFHIHTNDMLLTKINGEPLAEPIWVDTAIVPRNGSITFRSRFLDFTGKYMLHCHMMNHEELGMMQVVEVYADPRLRPASRACGGLVASSARLLSTVPKLLVERALDPFARWNRFELLREGLILVPCLCRA